MGLPLKEQALSSVSTLRKMAYVKGRVVVVLHASAAPSSLSLSFAPFQTVLSASRRQDDAGESSSATIKR